MNGKRRSVLHMLSVVLLLGAVLGAALPAAAQGGVQVRTTANLHLRGAPTTASQILTTIPNGTLLTATAISPSYRWLRVSYAGMTGWVFRAYAAPEIGNVRTLPISSQGIPPAVTFGELAPRGSVIVAPTVDLNMRLEPDPEADRITIIPRGAQVSALAVNANGLWVLVEYRNLRGWAAGRYLNVVSGSMAALPGPSGPPSISFTADRTTIALGECVTISWNVQNVRTVSYQGQGVVGQGSRTECPAQTTTYNLQVITLDNQVIERQITITVTGTVPVGGQTSIVFTASVYTISPGQCTVLSWFVQNAQAVFYQNQGVTGTGSRTECPTATTTYTLRVITPDNQTLERLLTITVTGTAPGGTTPSITFTASSYSITSGQCVVVSWNVTGVQAVFYQGQGVVGQGSRTECPTTTTTYTLRVITLDNQTIDRQLTVNVS